MDGILCIDKPPDFTSHDVVARVRRILGTRRVGHTGTLDPFATGLLVLLVGRATRLSQYLAGAVKQYDATIRVGFATDTGDLTGARTGTPPPDGWPEDFIAAGGLSAAKLEAALAQLRGEIEQTPPMYSAKKQDGKRLYKLARAGLVVERKSVPVTVYKFELAELDAPLHLRHEGTVDLCVRVECTAGTYVRVLAEDLGVLLGVGAHLASLRRTRAGSFLLHSACTLDQLEALKGASEGGPATRLLSMSAALDDMDKLQLSDQELQLVRNGVALPAVLQLAQQIRNDKREIALLDHAGALVAIGRYDIEAACIRPHMVLSSDQ